MRHASLGLAVAIAVVVIVVAGSVVISTGAASQFQRHLVGIIVIVVRHAAFNTKAECLRDYNRYFTKSKQF